MGLQADVAGMRVIGRTLAAIEIRICELCYLLVIEANRVVLAMHLNFVHVPALRNESRTADICLLAFSGSDGYVVDCAGPVLVEPIRYSLLRISTSKFINLYFKARVDADKGLVVVAMGHARAVRHRQLRVAEATEHSRVVVYPAQREFKPQDEVAEGPERVVEETQVAAGIGNDLAVLKRENPISSARPRIEAGFRSVEKRFKAWICVEGLGLTKNIAGD